MEEKNQTRDERSTNAGPSIPQSELFAATTRSQLSGSENRSFLIETLGLYRFYLPTYFLNTPHQNIRVQGLPRFATASGYRDSTTKFGVDMSLGS